MRAGKRAWHLGEWSRFSNELFLLKKILANPIIEFHMCPGLIYLLGRHNRVDAEAQVPPVRRRTDGLPRAAHSEARLKGEGPAPPARTPCPSLALHQTPASLMAFLIDHLKYLRRAKFLIRFRRPSFPPLLR